VGMVSDEGRGGIRILEAVCCSGMDLNVPASEWASELNSWLAGKLR